MNVTLVYNKEINRLDGVIKNLKERKLKLPLMANHIDSDIKKIEAKRDELKLDLEKESNMTDAYIENVLKRHNSTRFKL